MLNVKSNCVSKIQVVNLLESFIYYRNYFVLKLFVFILTFLCLSTHSYLYLFHFYLMWLFNFQRV